MAAKKAKAAKKAVAKKPAAKKAPAKKLAAKAPAKKAAVKSAAKKAAPKHPRVIHWEIQSKMPEKLHDFYSDVFGWSIDANNPMKYGMVESKGADGINGGIGGSESPSAEVLVYVGVPSIDDVLEKIMSSGGRTLMPRTDIGPVIMAIFQDPEGNTMGLVEG